MEIERTGAVSFQLFYLRRLLRIFPACYLVLGLAALYGWSSGKTDAWWVLGQILHLTNYQIIAGGWNAPIAPHTNVYWSLAVEEHFYLVFPVLFVVLAKLTSRAWRAGLLLAACGVVLLWRCWLIFGLDASYDRTYLGTDTRIDSILFGCVLALWGNPAIDSTKISESTWKHVLLALSVVGIFVTFGIREEAFRATFAYTVQGLCLFSIFVTAVRYPNWGPMRFLNYRFVRWIGALSYPIYLIHLSTLALTKEIFGTSLLLLLPAATIVTVVAAAAIYHGIEVPVGRLRKKLSVLARTDQPKKDGAAIPVIAASTKDI